LQSTIKQAQADAAQNRPTKAGTALANATEAAVTSKSLKDIALDKKIAGADAVADAATATSSGDLGIDTSASPSAAIYLKSGNDSYTVSFDVANATVRDVVNEINKSGIATAFVDEKGQLNIKGNGSDNVQFGFAVGADDATAEGAAATAVNSNTKLGFVATDATTTPITGQNITSSVRSNLIQQYNDLRTQIDEL
ncbi:flagellin, partial [Bosea thiooxidans]